MVLIKPILILGLGILCVGMLLSFRSRLVLRLGAVGFLLAGFVFVLFPDLANDAAHLVGVARGADLWLYLQSLSSLFIALALYRRAMAHERRIAEIARAIAVDSAKAPETGKEIRQDS